MKPKNKTEKNITNAIERHNAWKEKRWRFLTIAFVLIIFLIGVIFGLAVGIKTGQMMLFEGLGIALADSNINITIDLNETEIIEGARMIAEEVIVPALNNMEIE